MWSKTFDQRLSSWYNLRQSVKTKPIESALNDINQWWYSSPWQPYYLHWDDQDTWPDPWQLLSDNVYCDLARGLGILYTISFVDRADMVDAELILTKKGYNLVSVAQGKYILNWTQDAVVNNNHEVQVQKQLTQYQIKQQYN